MAEHPNTAILRGAYEAFAKVDLDVIRELIAEDTVWHVRGNHRLSGEYKGRDEVFDLLAKAITLSEGTLALEVHDVLANEGHGIVLLTEKAQRGSKSLEMHEVHVLHLNAQGQATEWWEYPEDQVAYDEFWS
jgi:hypothetical protein